MILNHLYHSSIVIHVLHTTLIYYLQPLHGEARAPAHHGAAGARLALTSTLGRAQQGLGALPTSHILRHETMEELLCDFMDALICPIPVVTCQR